MVKTEPMQSFFLTAFLIQSVALGSGKMAMKKLSAYVYTGTPKILLFFCYRYFCIKPVKRAGFRP